MGHHNERRQPRSRRRFSDEFKRDAVELVLTTGRPIAEVAAELGIYDSTLGNWVRRHQEQQQAGSGLGPDERARLKELEAENARLRRAVADLTIDKVILTEAARIGNDHCGAPLPDGRPHGTRGHRPVPQRQTLEPSRAGPDGLGLAA
jgi:transposase